MLKIDQWLRQGQGKGGQHFTPETCPHQVLLMEMMSEIPISSNEPKGGQARILQDAERNAAYFGKFKRGYFMYFGPGSQKTWNLKKNPDNAQSKLDEPAKTNYGCVDCTEIEDRW